ncbi:MAG: protein kinase, partial [Rhodothermales bacterium]|nr:protein kinase [Rhodothermales bacterium]
MLGQTLAHYEIESQLGQGGMGVVYLARDTKLDRVVAIKFLTADLTVDDTARERFIREAKAAAAIQHETICAIHEIGETESGETYIVMPHYEGRTLKELIGEGPLEPMRAMSIAQQIAGGLAAAHAKGVVHRDIKPGNVLVDARGRVKILDFGLAKLSGQMDLTRSKSSVGTVPYMAPEQLLAKTIDERTDIWALGALMYEMLTGRRAFEGEYEQAVSYAIVNTEPPPPHEHVAGIPAGVENIVMKCLAKDPGKRYQSVGELLSEIDVPTAARPLTTTTLSRLIHKDVSLQAGTFVGIFGAVVVLFVVAFFLFGRSSEISSLKNRHLAILPFNFIGDSGDSDVEAFSYGLMETLTTSLSRLQGTDQSLWVIPSSEVTESMTLDDARRQLKADLVVQGSVQLEGQRVRVNLTLNDAKTRRVINSDVFDYTGTGSFAIQDEAVDRLLSMLGLTETTDAQIAAVGAASQ